MDQWDRDKAFRLGLVQTAEETSPPHARVDQNRYGPCLVQPKDNRDEVDPRPNQQGQPSPRPSAHIAKPESDPVAVFVQLSECEMAIDPFSMRIISQRLDHRNGVGTGLGHPGESASNIMRVFQHIPIMPTIPKSCNARLAVPLPRRVCLSKHSSNPSKSLFPRSAWERTTVGRSASIEVENALPQQVTSPMDSERPTVRYDSERRNESAWTGWANVYMLDGPNRL
jgi:hypothetical protein